MYYSFIIPAFNRPDEIRELLESFTVLQLPASNMEGFEIIIADGSPTPILSPLLKEFESKLIIHHLHRPRLPISPSRNLGAEHAKGDYLIFLDSDVILPQSYLSIVHQALLHETIDAFGGPDAAHKSFTMVQKAISFAMTSYLTTGGIRGGKKQIHQFNPRGFNMGIRKDVFHKMKGFSSFSCGEDIELSIRIINEKFTVKLIADAFVYHKRRTTFASFFRQVFRFGAARINIFHRHRNELKITHFFPSAFMGFIVLGIFSALISTILFNGFLIVIACYFLAIFCSSASKEKNLLVGFLSIVASIFQLFGYGSGFILNAVAVFMLGKKDGLALGASK